MNGAIVADLPISPWIVRSETIEAQKQAYDVLSAAQASAARLHAEAAAQADELRKSARQDGLRDGATAAAALVAEFSSSLEIYRAAREAELSTLAFAIAHRILGAFSEEDRLIRAVRTALDEHRNTTGLRLRASPEMASALRTALDGARAAPSITIEPDETASPGSCTLIHPRGRIAVGPVDQLLALFAAVVPGATP
ncbi:type III secretion system stator protein SctL [Bradyrhizobium sp. Tv2a-2]|uniref:type III secretion system stator protein SctL n=1 Tax=Bradyrhizobium sp. Tv2a-2 TaxID=113395 RepID=UPI000560F79D|nr:type III secretion system stator protein SctL [Bradyrhizobium sp. Tv2a-2]